MLRGEIESPRRHEQLVSPSSVYANYSDRCNQLPNQDRRFHQPHVLSITNQRLHQYMHK